MTQAIPDDGREPAREELFAVFFGAHRRGVERFVRLQIGTDLAELDDVCAEVFFVALRRFDLLHDLPLSTARGWLLSVANHKCSNVRRSRFRRDRAYRRVATNPANDGYDPFEEVHLQRVGDDVQIADQAREVLASLPETHRTVLQLELDGPISGRQMAVALGTTDGAGRLRLMRAKRAFGAEYARRYGWTGDRPDEGGGS